MINRNSRSALMVLLTIGVGGCGPETSNAVVDVKDLFEEFARQSYEPNIDAYVVQGDITFSTKEDLRAHYDSELHQLSTQNSMDGLMRRGDPLIIKRVNDRDDLWTEGQRRTLQYCVSTLFGANHAGVVKAMSEAARDWEQAADVKFIYLDSWDNYCTPRNKKIVQQGEVLFAVQPNSHIKGNATAFFPNDAPSRRVLRLNWTKSNNAGLKTPTGILRHELGHILGFLHEHMHSRMEEGVCLYRDATTYEKREPEDYRDNYSVMYYTTCDDSKKNDYTLSMRDRHIAANLYGSSRN